ncbi:MAG: hypothetical protein PUF50_07430 [Erysipelotrichaceae bacterium]|nr:hypothetical protein [Erysipelotrichaceae bacterium]
MKKLLIIGACLLLLVGCSDASAMVKDKNQSVITIGGKKITKGQMYEILREQDQSETALRLLTNYIVNKEIETTAEVEAEAKIALDASIEKLGNSLDSFLAYYDYENVDEYYEKEILPETKKEFLKDVYIEENWDAVIAYYYPTKVRIIETKTTEEANTALQEIKDGKDFEAVAKQYSTQSNKLYDGTEQLVSRNDSQTLTNLVTQFIRDAETPTLSAIIHNDAADKFYIVQITNCNPAQFKEEAMAEVASASDLETEMIAYYCKKYNFKVYDITLYNYLKENYPTYLNQK